MKIIYWENIISQHKVPYWNFLAKSDKVSQFILVVEQVLGDDLKSQGWESELESHSKLEVIVNPSESKIIDLFKNNIENSYHVFSGIRAIPMVFTAFKLSLSFPVHRILLTETINLNGVRGITRRLYAVINERKYLKYFDLILGSGLSTQKWYLENGFRSDNFYSFLYCVDYPKKQYNEDFFIKKSKFQLLFVGQLIERKGLDVLINALGLISNFNWHLDVYGKGIDEDKYVKLTEKHKLVSKITFKGTINNSELINQIRKYDALVLPSRFDGWGAVVNEAIASGVKVICSDRCGASILLINPTIGSVFQSTNTKQLSELLKESIGDNNNTDHASILEYSDYLKGENVADYLIEILEYHYEKIGERPLPPWEKYLRNQRNEQSFP